MKAVIKVCTDRKEFRQDQLAIMKRVAIVLTGHDLLVEVIMKEKVKKPEAVKLKAV